jgi:beta-mannanase
LRDARDKGGLAMVASGAYDFYIDEWAKAAAKYKHTIMLRFAHEMNDPYRYPWGPQNNQPQDFIAAWQHVVQRFRGAGANNVLFMWAPHLAYAGWEHYWPGGANVDWVATGALNYGTVAYWSKWWTFEQIFGDHYAAFAGLKKPIMIAELGTVSVGGDKTKWYAEAMDQIKNRYPAVKAVLFFNVHNDKTVTYQAIDWSVERDTAVLRVLREQTVPHTERK